MVDRATGFIPGLAAQLVERVGGPRDHMKRIRAAHRVLAVGLHGVGDPVGCIGRNVGDLGAAVLAEQLEEAVQRGLVAAHAGPEEPAGVVVDHDGQVPVPALVGDLIDPDAAEPLQAVHLRVDLALNACHHSAYGPPSDPHQLGDGGLRRGGGQPADGVFEVAGEPRPVPRPRHLDGDHAVVPAADTHRLRLQIHPDRAQIQAPPTTRTGPGTAAVIARLSPPAHPAPARSVTAGPHRGHDLLGVRVELDRPEHHSATQCRQTQHMTP